MAEIVAVLPYVLLVLFVAWWCYEVSLRNRALRKDRDFWLETQRRYFDAWWESQEKLAELLVDGKELVEATNDVYDRLVLERDELKNLDEDFPLIVTKAGGVAWDAGAIEFNPALQVWLHAHGFYKEETKDG